MSSPPRARPLRIAVVNDYEIVVAGIAAVLEPYAERVTVVELAAGLPVLSDVDVLLYDTFGQRSPGPARIEQIVTGGARLVVFGWDSGPDLVQASIAAGASGYVSKGSRAVELVEALERVHAGECVVPEPQLAATTGGEVGTGDVPRQEMGRWPGDEHGLSAREAEVLALICAGFSNEEITTQIFIGINTVKTHIRTLYRKIGVTRRTQAVLWGYAHGLEPDRARDLDP